jgi:hypothetical protein
MRARPQICLPAPDSDVVKLFHARALEGATDEGAPGERTGAMITYFGAFIIDSDGNKIEAATHGFGSGRRHRTDRQQGGGKNGSHCRPSEPPPRSIS